MMMRTLKQALLSALALATLLCAALPGARAEFFGAADGRQWVEIEENSTMTLRVGSSLVLSLYGYVYPEKAYNLSSVTSTNPAVAAIAEDGTVTALSAGVTDIVWAFASEGVVYDTCTLKLTVVNSYEPAGIRFRKKNMTIYTGMRVDMRTLLNTDPAGTAVDYSQLKWSTGDKSVVSINKNGRIQAKKPGKATITVTYGTLSASVAVKVGRNKVDNLTAKPNAAKLKSNSYDVLLKSVEIVSSKKAVAEFYFVANYPSNYTCVSLDLFENDLWGHWLEIPDSDPNNRICSITGNRIESIKLNLKGRGVKVFRVVYNGLDDCNFNLKADKKDVSVSWEADLKYKITKKSGNRKKTVTQKVHKERIRLN